MIPIKEKVKSNIFDFIESLFFKFIWIFLPLMFWPGISEPVEFFKVLIFICVSFMYFGYLLDIVPRPIVLGKSGLFWLIMGLLIIQVLSSVLNNRISVSFFGLQYRYQGVLTQLSYLLFVLAIVFSKKLYLNYIKFGAIGVTVAIAAEAIAFKTDKVIGILGNPNFTGGYLALTLAFIDNPIIFGIVGMGVFMTGSRSALIAGLVILVVKLSYKVNNAKLMVVIFLSILLSSFLWFPQKQISHFDNRLVIWQKGIEAGFKKPILGWGIENFEVAFTSVLKPNDFDLKDIRVDRAHNEFLEMFVNSGMVGLMIYVSIIFLILKNTWGDRPIFLSFVGYMIIANLNVLNINEYLFFYLALGLAVKNQLKIFL